MRGTGLGAHSLLCGWGRTLFPCFHLVKEIVTFSEGLSFLWMALGVGAVLAIILVEGILSGVLPLLLIQWLVRGFSKTADKIWNCLSWGVPLLCWMHRRWALLFQGGLECCSIAGQMILFGEGERFHIHCNHRVRTDTRRGGKRSSWPHLCCVSSLSPVLGCVLFHGLGLTCKPLRCPAPLAPFLAHRTWCYQCQGSERNHRKLELQIL